MVLHSALLVASAEAHRHDLLAEAERYRTAKAVRAALRRSVRAPDRPPPREPEKPREECRYAVSR
jgi:hypothetical protein